MEFQIGNQVRIPDDGWERPGVGTVVGNHPGMVYVERFDGAIAQFYPSEIDPVEGHDG